MLGWDKNLAPVHEYITERGAVVNAYHDVSLNFWIVAAIIATITVVALLVMFLLGFRAGSSKARQFKNSWNIYQKERQHRRIIRMQVAPKPKRPSRYTGYYPSAQARRNQAKYRRAREEQTRMRDM